MTLKTWDIGDTTVVQVPGPNLDASNADDFRSGMSLVLANAKKVVLDLRDVEFMDSAALGSFLSCLRQINSAGGDLVLSSMRKPVRSLFELVRMHRVFAIYDTPEAAVDALAQGQRSGQ